LCSLNFTVSNAILKGALLFVLNEIAYCGSIFMMINGFSSSPYSNGNIIPSYLALEGV
jgi:hypothetical protein